MHRMVRRLPARLEDLHEAAAVTRGALDGGGEIVRREVIRARAGHQQPVALDQRERELVQLAICGLRPAGCPSCA